MFRKISLLLIISIFSYAQSMYVNSEDLNVRLSPSKYGKKTSVLLKGQRVDIYEIKNGWARVTEYYDGFSEGVDKRVARWVSYKYLSNNKPIKKIISNNSPIAKAISGSDDYERYYKNFTSVSEQLVKNNVCTIKDFKNGGGWTRSTTRGKGVYFTYCGGYTLSNKIYYNIIRGKITR